MKWGPAKNSTGAAICAFIWLACVLVSMVKGNYGLSITGAIMFSTYYGGYNAGR